MKNLKVHKKFVLLVAILIAVTLVMIGIFFPKTKKTSPSVSSISQTPSPFSVQSTPTPTSAKTTDLFVPPLDKAAERITKKKFGQYITPQNSPVQPEKFTGYHTGVDFEIFPEELNQDVFVRAVCQGQLVLKETASGYGGLAVESCNLDNQPITVAYGHLKLSSVSKSVGDQVQAGEVIAILGANKSVETDGERKHLHLGFHQGSKIDIRGYVQDQTELSAWIDPCLYVCHD